MAEETAEPAEPPQLSFQDLVSHFRQRLLASRGELLLTLGLEDAEEPDGSGGGKGSASASVGGGLLPDELLTCLDRLNVIAAKVPCQTAVLHLEGLGARSGKRRNCTCAVLLRQTPEQAQDPLLEIRVAVVGNVDAGKS